MGYPDGLSGDEIPITAQIACVADAFDAMTSTRPYRKGIKAEDAVRQIADQRGRQFGPIAVDAFKSLMDRKAGR
jgi:HD-GYP domain-containing protein (c-di-GMP phosphodiesterase class II)